MRFYLYLLFSLLATSLAAQSASTTTGCAPLTVNFTAPAGGGTFWVFGNGSTSTVANPSTVFTDPGTYEVELRASSGGALRGTVTITVFAQPELTLSVVPDTVCAALPTRLFTAIELNPAITARTFTYALGDGASRSSTDDTISYTYTQAGTYDVTVQLSTSLPSCNTTQIFEDAVFVAEPIQVAFASNPSPAQVCTAPAAFQFSDRTVGAEPISYFWDFGNGQTSTLANPPTATYATVGDYRVTLTATDANGCTGTSTQNVSVGSPSAAFELPDTVCFGETYTLFPLGAALTYTFAYGPGVTFLSDSMQVPTVRFDQAGNTTVSLTVNGAICSGDTVRNIFVQSIDVGASATPDESCFKAFEVGYSTIDLPGATVAWTFEYDTTNAGGSSVTKEYTYNEGGEFGYNESEPIVATALLSTTAGCVFEDTVTTNIDVPNALYIPSTLEGCAPLAVTFFDSTRSTETVTSYVFDWGDGQTETFATNGPWQHTYADPGTYNPVLSIETAAGCSDTSFAYTITAGTLLGSQISFTADVDQTCPGDELSFVNTTPSDLDLRIHFEVEGGASQHCASNDTLRHVLTRPIEGSTIALKLYVDDRGCIDSSQTAAYPYVAAPVAQLDYELECESPFDIKFFNNSTGSNFDSVLVEGISDRDYTATLSVNPLDSAELTLPTRGTYRAILVARNVANLSGCGPQRDTVEFYITVPVADFDIDPELCFGSPLELDGSPSQDVNACCEKGYQWEFTFDRPYVTEEPTNMDVTGAGGNDGQDSVTLIVTDINSCSDTTSRRVRFFRTGLTATANDDRICFPTTLAFDLEVISDTTISSYAWDFDGAGTSEDQNPSFTFAQDQFGQTLNVSVMTEDALGCPGSAQLSIPIYRPTSMLIAEPRQICEGDAVTFSATDFTEEGSSLTYNISFGNGTTDTNPNQTITYPTAGTYPVLLDYTEVGSGCSGQARTSIEVQTTPNVSFTADADGSEIICFPQLINFTDTSPDQAPYTRIWDAGNTVSSDASIAVGLPRGTTEVRLIGVTSAGCADTASQSFTLTAPDGRFVATPDAICVGDEVTLSLADTVGVASFEFDLGNGVVVSDESPVAITYDELPASGFTVVSLTLRSATGECDFAFTDTLNFDVVTADFVTDNGTTSACEPTVAFQSRSVGAERFAYDFAGQGSRLEPNPTFLFPGGGTYAVTLAVSKADGSCRDTLTQDITILEPLVLDVDVASACVGQETVLFVNANRDISTITVDPFGIAFSDRGNRFTFGPVAASTVVDVVAQDSFGCSATLSDLAINVTEGFQGVGDTTTIIRGGAAVLDLNGAPGDLGYTWTDPGATGCLDCPRPTVRPEDTRTYGLTVVDANGCRTDEIQFLVIVIDEPIVPNLFTPNGDGSNDDWGPLLPEGVPPTVNTYRVYSRWGSLVFEGSDASQRWNGETPGGEEAPSDVYAYVIEFVFADGQSVTRSGEVTLLR